MMILEAIVSTCSLAGSSSVGTASSFRGRIEPTGMSSRSSEVEGYYLVIGTPGDDNPYFAKIASIVRTSPAETAPHWPAVSS